MSTAQPQRVEVPGGRAAEGGAAGRPFRLRADAAQLLVIDLQQRLLPHIDEQARVVSHSVRMILAARELGLPMTLTEQYVRGLGPTDGAVLGAFGDGPRFEKLAFSSCGDRVVRDRIDALKRPQVLIVGIETHVCVLQSVLDLLEAGLTPVVLADAVGSRRAIDRECALERMRRDGAMVSTVESSIYEFMRVAGTEQFKRMLPILK